MLYLVFHLFICQLVLTTGFQFSLVLNVFREKKLIVSFLVKYKILEMFATD